MKQMVKAGLLVLLIGSALALPLQEAAAATRCREVVRHGVVVKRTCVKVPNYHRGHRARDHRYDQIRDHRYRGHRKYQTVCKTYWRHGVKYRSCRRVPYRY